MPVELCGRDVPNGGLRTWVSDIRKGAMANDSVVRFVGAGFEGGVSAIEIEG